MHIFCCFPLWPAVDFPLKAYAKEDNFRLYMNDIGLLISTYPYELKRALLEDRALDEGSPNFILKVAKGGIYEALAADLLIKKGYTLYFFRNDTGSVENRVSAGKSRWDHPCRGESRKEQYCFAQPASGAG